MGNKDVGIDKQQSSASKSIHFEYKFEILSMKNTRRIVGYGILCVAYIRIHIIIHVFHRKISIQYTHILRIYYINLHHPILRIYYAMILLVMIQLLCSIKKSMLLLLTKQRLLKDSSAVKLLVQQPPKRSKIVGLVGKYGGNIIDKPTWKHCSASIVGVATLVFPQMVVPQQLDGF